jgi:ComF family protein
MIGKKLSNLSAYILNGCSKFVHAIFPYHCALCGTSISNRLLCTGCDADLSRYRVTACPICALPTLNNLVCGHCLQRRPTFDHTLAAFSYHFPIDRLLHAFKYSGDLALIEILAKPLAQLAADHPRPDLLMPMPLHPERLKERGFNQSMEIAKPISRWLSIPLSANACQRTRNTPSQTGLKWKERRRNVRGAFACDLDLTGKKIAVLDDVMTTGATLNELSRILKNCGASEVSAWVVARTIK